MISIRFNSSDNEFAKQIRKITGYTPKNLKVYKLAFTHKTVANKSENTKFREDNERLEFLGDAILDLVVAELLFFKFPLKDEGFLTEMRSKMVSREKLGKLSEKIGLQNLIHFDITVGARKDILYTLGGNALEALVGAFYLDHGYKKTVRFIKKKIIEAHLDLKELEESEISYKGKLFEYAQKNKKVVTFQTLREFKKAKSNFFEIQLLIDNEPIASETNHSKKKAEEIVCEKAWKKLFADQS